MGIVVSAGPPGPALARAYGAAKAESVSPGPSRAELP